jgi:type IV pilus assembly protein PilF
MAVVTGQVHSTRWVRAALAAAGLVAGLSGCVSTTTTTSGNPGPRSADGKDMATASDQTSTDRLVKVRMDLASAYFARGQAKDALDEVKQVLNVRPTSAEAYALRGLIYAQLGEPGTADESFHKALSLAPHDADTMHNYGWFLCQQQRYPEADAQFAQAIAEPSYRGQSRTLLAQGVCQARAGHMAESEKTLSRSYELDPANPTTAVNLSEVLYKRGEFERARFYIRRVNTKQELQSAQTLWLAAQIERKLGQEEQVQEMGAQLHKRFPQAPETLLFEKGRFE